LRDKDYYDNLNDERVLERFWYPMLAAEDLVYDPVYGVAQWFGLEPGLVDGVPAGEPGGTGLAA